MEFVIDTLISLCQSWTLPPLPYSTSLAASLSLLILSEANGFYAGSAGFKLLASLSFLTAGIKAASHKVDLFDWNAIQSADNMFTVGMVAALLFSFIGDALLIPSSISYHSTDPETKKKEGQSPWFRLGTFFFGLAHISYIIAFFGETGVEEARWDQFSAALLTAFFISHLLGPLQMDVDPNALIVVPKEIQTLVMTYICIIIGMVATATATDKGTQKIAGAWTFMASDIFVAYDVFGKKSEAAPSPEKKGKKKASVKHAQKGRAGWRLRGVGWVLYFGAQLLLAGSI